MPADLACVENQLCVAVCIGIASSARACRTLTAAAVVPAIKRRRPRVYRQPGVRPGRHWDPVQCACVPGRRCRWIWRRGRGGWRRRQRRQWWRRWLGAVRRQSGVHPRPALGHGRLHVRAGWHALRRRDVFGARELLSGGGRKRWNLRIALLDRVSRAALQSTAAGRRRRRQLREVQRLQGRVAASVPSVWRARRQPQSRIGLRALGLSLEALRAGVLRLSVKQASARHRAAGALSLTAAGAKKSHRAARTLADFVAGRSRRAGARW